MFFVFGEDAGGLAGYGYCDVGTPCAMAVLVSPRSQRSICMLGTRAPSLSSIHWRNRRSVSFASMLPRHGVGAISISWYSDSIGAGRIGSRGSTHAPYEAR